MPVDGSMHSHLLKSPRLVRRLNSLFNRSMKFVVRSEIHSTSGKLKKVRQEWIVLYRQDTADGRAVSHFSTKTLKSPTTFFLEVA